MAIVTSRELPLLTVTGFNGKISRGLELHPNEDTLLYGLGNSLVLKNLNERSGEQLQFLSGHSNMISCLRVSPSGKLLASGQETHMGFKTSVIIWDYETKLPHSSHELHKVKVQAVGFTADEQHVISLGGDDDRSVIIWSLSKKDALCGSQSSQGIEGFASCLVCIYSVPEIFITAGCYSLKIGGIKVMNNFRNNYRLCARLDGNETVTYLYIKKSRFYLSETLRVWNLDVPRQHVSSTLVPSGHLRREIVCLEIDKNDEFFYCGTTSGDILKFRLRLGHGSVSETTNVCSPIFICSLTRKLQPRIKSPEQFYSKGVSSLWVLPEGDLLVGTGTGTLIRTRQTVSKTTPIATAITKPKLMTSSIKLEEIQRTQMEGKITSIAVHERNLHVRTLLLFSPYGMSKNYYTYLYPEAFIGTNLCQIFKVPLDSFEPGRIATCHSTAISDIIFPMNCSELFITCGKEEIRVWAAETITELLKIKVPKAICNSIHCTDNGHSIVSGWDNGSIIVFSPETGKEMYSMSDSHAKGVTSIAGTHNSLWIISGGGDGQVRIWAASPAKQCLVSAMKEHKGRVSGIVVHSSDRECVTASTDGTCIIWDLKRFTRRQIIFANTLFQCVCYGPEECQVITGGTDRKVAYWEVFNGSLIREIEGSTTSGISTMDITSDARYFITAGSDKVLKVWDYHEGKVIYEGKGHAASITKVKVAPNRQYIISVSSDGAILKWKLPDEPKS